MLPRLLPGVSRRWPVLAFFACTFALWGDGAAAERTSANEPRLILPGNRLVEAGQLIDLRWAPADSIVELEILLSPDGGRHYSICISPPLDPRSCHYLWRVPNLGPGPLRMRIRFNRGGREIEGAPTAPLFAFAGGRDQAQPLALPPADSPGRGAPKSNDRGETPMGRSESEEISDQVTHTRHTSSGEALRPAAREVGHPRNTKAPLDAPRFVLRI